MLCRQGVLALYCFMGTISLLFFLTVPPIVFNFIPDFFGAAFWGPLFYYALLNMVLRFSLKGPDCQIAVRAAFLGCVFSISILLIWLASSNWKTFGIYGCILSFFHFSEYLCIAWCNPDTLSTDSFVLNNSIFYTMAIACSWIEFIAETIWFPDLKTMRIFWIIGISVCIFGEALRKLAMITAKTNFNHLVQHVKAKNHRLITHGIYSKMRHPSYVGWFWWSIGTQILLFNPICLVIYSIVSWRFFNERIKFEELTLLNFFGEHYYEYQQKVSTGLPFIKGYSINYEKYN